MPDWDDRHMGRGSHISHIHTEYSTHTRQSAIRVVYYHDKEFMTVLPRLCHSFYES